MQEGNDSISTIVSLEKSPVSQLLIPPPKNFDFLKPDLWPLWKKRFERYLDASNFSAKSETEQLNTLCYIMGEETELLLAQVMPDTEGKTLTEVLQAFTDYFCPKKNVVLERYRFNSRIQESDETVDQFITALHALAKSCQYGIMKDVLIRDRIIVGLADAKICEELRLKSYLTLEDATTIARQADLKLRETTKPYALDQTDRSYNSDTLYQKVQKALNEATPRNFDILVGQFRSLPINSVEQLQGVVDLVYEKAIAKPSLMPMYARLCKELATMQVSNPNDEESEKKNDNDFRKLIITRCQMEFEKNFEEPKACADLKKKMEIQLAIIGFIGELFKQSMLTAKIMHWCVRYFLVQMDDGSLECLCKLLSTTGEDLETKNQNVKPYLKQILDIVSGKVPSKTSPRVRFMLQDLIELKMNKWIPSKDNSSPLTVNQIQNKPGTTQPNTQVINIPTIGPKKAVTNCSTKTVVGGGPTRLCGVGPWAKNRKRKSIEASKPKNIPPLMGSSQLVNTHTVQWSRNVTTHTPITVRPYPLMNTSRNDVPRVNSNYQLPLPGPSDFIPLQRLM